MKQTLLKREIGVWGLSLNLMNIMIGAGIFVMPAIVAEGLGTASFSAYLFCGFLISLVMLCFAEVGSIITSDGGVYAYIDRTLGDYFGFKAVVLFLLAAISADAAIANAVVDILDSLLPLELGSAYRTIIFFVIFSTLAIINIRGTRQGVALVKMITIFKLAPLVLFVMLVSPDIKLEFLQIESLPTLREFGQISLILFFAFQGAESGLSVNGEVKNPQKTIPRAIFIAISGALILYMMIQLISQGIMGPELGNVKQNTLGEVASIVLGPIGLTLMIIGGAVSMLGSISSEILSIPRILYGAAKDNVLPIKALAAIHPRFATPYAAILAYSFLDFLFASIGGFTQLAILSSTTVLLVYLGVAIAVIRLRMKHKTRVESSFRIPGGYVVPIAAIAVILWFLSNLTRKEMLTIGLIIVALTIVYFTLVIRLRKKIERRDVSTSNRTHTMP
ncbi:APC family permease [Bacteroidota bacterium]